MTESVDTPRTSASPRGGALLSARSYLYVPGDRPDRLEKAVERAGDAIIADLEDAVALPAKDVALREVVGWLAAADPTRRELWVRVNVGARGLEEIAALRELPALRGVLLPKATLESVRTVTAALGTGGCVAALVETARGLVEAAQLAAVPGVSHLGIGEADLTAELGVTPSADGRELLPLRMQIVVASAAAALPAPTGPVYLQVRDLEGLQASTQALRASGFGSRSAVHPDQVPVIEDVFTPTDAELATAREVVAAYDAALVAGTAVGVDAGGGFVDEAVVRAARRTVALGERLSR